MSTQDGILERRSGSGIMLNTKAVRRIFLVLMVFSILLGGTLISRQVRADNMIRDIIIKEICLGKV